MVLLYQPTSRRRCCSHSTPFNEAAQAYSKRANVVARNTLSDGSTGCCSVALGNHLYPSCASVGRCPEVLERFIRHRVYRWLRNTRRSLRSRPIFHEGTSLLSFPYLERTKRGSWSSVELYVRISMFVRLLLGWEVLLSCTCTFFLSTSKPFEVQVQPNLGSVFFHSFWQ